MIPLQLTLQNFLSYRQAALDFQGLHTACICGPNGAGKSSLLEAIAWSIWGNSRAGTEDHLIHTGEKEVRVDFIFQTNQQTYRVIRSRQRGHSSTLEFQIATESINPETTLEQLQFRPLTERGLRATQEKIIQHIKLDYETFVNSSYLRQGRADEFMLKRPSDRKQVLATLLRLDAFEQLADRAKERSREAKGQVQLLEQSVAATQEQLQQEQQLERQLEGVETQLKDQQEQTHRQRKELQELQDRQLVRQNWQQQIAANQLREKQLRGESDRVKQDVRNTQRRYQELEALLKQEPEIKAGYEEFSRLQAHEESLAGKFQAYQEAQQQRQNLQENFRQYLSTTEAKRAAIAAQYDALLQQERELSETLAQGSDVQAGMVKLQQARDRLADLEELESRATPLIQRQQTLQSQLDRTRARLSARLEEIVGQMHRLQVEQQNSYALEEALTQLAIELDELEKKRVYQQRVREKGLERRNFMERLKAHQRDYEGQLGKIDQKIQMLQVPDAICPLCDRPLGEHDWDVVLHKHQTQQQDIINQMWVVREQLATSDREISILREEYRQLEAQLKPYNSLRERRGQLQAQIEATFAARERLEQLAWEKEELERSLHTGAYGGELYAELQAVTCSLEDLNYNERDRALALNEEKRWRWAEIKQGQLQQAQRHMEQLQQRKPKLETQLAELETQLERARTDSELQRQLEQLDRHMEEIGYDGREHQDTRVALRQAQVWWGRMEALRQAQQQFPQEQQRLEELESRLQEREKERQTLSEQRENLDCQLQEIPDAGDRIAQLEQSLERLQSSREGLLSTQGRLQQQQQHFARVKAQHEQKRRQLETARRNVRVYGELATAFGKNGIQALTIENVLPQLEAETNQILARLSSNQLHVQFITQRASRTRSKKKSSKPIDTLDILIADARGTRPYETYSGGEAFRINFAIRLALARLLAHRAGTALQMLIVDEGFGTQDREGCDRLVAAINAIAPEFACILTVTHMPQFKEAFQARIEVCKTPNGSQLSLSI